jgi:hypothetical protein
MGILAHQHRKNFLATNIEWGGGVGMQRIQLAQLTTPEALAPRCRAQLS